MSNDLVIALPESPEAVFSGIESILKQIEELAGTAPKNAETPENRKAIVSMAYKVARTKTALDGLGKQLIETEQEKIKAVNAQRRVVTERLDALRAEIRKPVDEYEAMEEKRVAGHNAALQEAHACGARATEKGQSIENPAEFFDELERRLAPLETRDFEEFSGSAVVVIAASKKAIAEARARRTQYDNDQAELAKLRAERAERERLEHERKVAEAAAAAERERQEAEKKRIEDEKNRAIAEQKARAEAAQLEAEAAEKKRQAEEARAKEAEARAKQFEEDKRIANAKASAMEIELQAQAEGRKIEQQRNAEAQRIEREQYEKKLEDQRAQMKRAQEELLARQPAGDRVVTTFIKPNVQQLREIAESVFPHILAGSGHEGESSMRIARAIAAGSVAHVRCVGVHPPGPEARTQTGDPAPDHSGPGQLRSRPS